MIAAVPSAQHFIRALRERGKTMNGCMCQATGDSSGNVHLRTMQRDSLVDIKRMPVTD